MPFLVTSSIQSLQMSRNIKLQPALVALARLKPPALMSDISELGPGLGAGLRGSETSEEKFMQTESERKYSVLWKSEIEIILRKVNIYYN